MMARRGRGGGPDGLAVVVGATTPPFGGFAVAVLAVRSTDEGFSADVEVVPALVHWHGPAKALTPRWSPGGPRTTAASTTLASRASGIPARTAPAGRSSFWPALDPAARVLDIMPTTMAARAVIRVPLAWGVE